MKNMAPYLANKIKEAYDTKGLEEAQAIYRGLFVRTPIYAKYQEDVNTILIAEGLELVIVTK